MIHGFNSKDFAIVIGHHANREDLMSLTDNTGEDGFKVKINEILNHLRSEYRYLLDLKIEYHNEAISYHKIIRLSATSSYGMVKSYQMVIPEVTLAYDSDAALYEYIKKGLEELNMAMYGEYGGYNVTASGNGGDGYGGGGGYSNSTYMQHTHTPMHTIGSYNQTNKEREEAREREEKEVKAREKIEARRIKQAKKDFTLADISNYKKEIMLDTLHETLKMYNYKKGANNMTKGIKWLLFFLGFAILLNFGKILDIVTLVVN